MGNRFKAWDKKMKRMVDPYLSEGFIMGINFKGEVIAYEEDSNDPELFVYSDRFELLENSRMADIHEQDAFREDVIRVFERDRRYQIQKVVFKDGMFCGYSEKKACPYTSLDSIKRNHGFEILGSALESPELWEER